MSPAEYFFALVAMHALCDYPLQGDYLARAKCRRSDLGKGCMWMQALGAHALIQGGGVFVVTGIWWLGALEALAHALIDFGKCEGRYGIHVDQGLHVACKIVWLAIFMTVGVP